MGHPYTHLSFQKRPLLLMGGPRYEGGSYLGPHVKDTRTRLLTQRGLPGTLSEMQLKSLRCTLPGKARCRRWPRARIGMGCSAHERQVCEGVGVAMFLFWATNSSLVMQARVLSPGSPQGLLKAGESEHHPGSHVHVTTSGPF